MRCSFQHKESSTNQKAKRTKQKRWKEEQKIASMQFLFHLLPMRASQKWKVMSHVIDLMWSVSYLEPTHSGSLLHRTALFLCSNDWQSYIFVAFSLFRWQCLSKRKFNMNYHLNYSFNQICAKICRWYVSSFY